MFNIAATFVYSVLTCYTLYRYFLEQNEFFRQLASVHLHWQLFYVIYALAVIYAGNAVASKVYRIYSYVKQCKNTNKFFLG